MEKSNQKRKLGEYGKCIKCQKTYTLNIGISPCCDSMLKPIDLTFNPKPVVDVPKQALTLVETPRVKKRNSTVYNRSYRCKELEPLKLLPDLYNSKIRILHINMKEELTTIKNTI